VPVSEVWYALSLSWNSWSLSS